MYINRVKHDIYYFDFDQEAEMLELLVQNRFKREMIRQDEN